MTDRVTIADRWVSFSSRYGIIAAAPAAPVERSAASPLRSGYLHPSQSAVQSTILFFGVSMRVRIVADNHGASKGIHRALTCRFRAIFTQIEQQSTTPLLLSAVFR
jgi:hypothetical protein